MCAVCVQHVWRIFQGLNDEDDEQNHIDTETHEDEDVKPARAVVRSARNHQNMSDNQLHYCDDQFVQC